MDVFQAIQSRRSIGKVKPDPVDKPLIEKLLEAATWAPNHHRTEPWRFIVLTGEGRKILGRAYAEAAKEESADMDARHEQDFLKKQEAKAFRAPVIIAVVASPSDRPNVVEIEEYGAVYMAMQNMLLAAHALGLGAVCRTGRPAYHPKMKERLGLSERETLLGLIYVGYPDAEPATPNRTHFAEKTTWIEHDPQP